MVLSPIRSVKIQDIRHFPVIPAGAFSIIQDGVQDGRQNVDMAIWSIYHLTPPPSKKICEWQKKALKIWPLKMDKKFTIKQNSCLKTMFFKIINLWYNFGDLRIFSRSKSKF